MKLQLSQVEFDTLVDVAERYEVDINKLEDMYAQVMGENFFTDLCDIVMLNEEELKKGD